MSMFDVDDFDDEEVFLWRPRVKGAPAHPLSSPQWINEYIEQTSRWVDGSAQSLDIATMDQGHALNAAVFMCSRATSIYVTASVKSPMSMAGDPLEFVMGTPLYSALITRAGEDDGEARPW